MTRQALSAQRGGPAAAARAVTIAASLLLVSALGASATRPVPADGDAAPAGPARRLAQVSAEWWARPTKYGHAFTQPSRDYVGSYAMTEAGAGGYGWGGGVGYSPGYSTARAGIASTWAAPYGGGGWGGRFGGGRGRGEGDRFGRGNGGGRRFGNGGSSDGGGSGWRGGGGRGRGGGGGGRRGGGSNNK